MAGRDDDVMEDAEPETRTQRLRSTVAAVPQVKKQKGRGFREQGGEDDRYDNNNFESLEPVSTGPAKSVEGYVVFVTGVHEEAQEEDIHEAFAEYGEIKNIYLNLDRQTGFVKGYALVEYGQKSEAQAAIQGLDTTELLTQKINVTWAFSRGPIKPASRASRRR